jgi:hypothetical protein
MSEIGPENLAEENRYRRIFRRAREQCQRYAERSWRTIKAIRYYCRAKRRTYGGWEKEKKIVELATVIGLWVYVVINGALLKNSGRQLELARSEFENAQRPWVAVTYPEVVSDFAFDLFGATISIHLHIKNSGHSPAAFVTVFPLIFTMDNDAEGINKVRATCVEARKRPFDQLTGGTVFPGDEDVRAISFRLSATDIMRLRSAPMSTTMLAGCIDYVFEFQPGHHQTGFVFEIDKRGLRNNILKIDPDSGDVAANQVLMEVNPGLGVTAD